MSDLEGRRTTDESNPSEYALRCPVSISISVSIKSHCWSLRIRITCKLHHFGRIDSVDGRVVLAESLIQHLSGHINAHQEILDGMNTIIKACKGKMSSIFLSSCYRRSQVMQGNFDSQVNKTKSAMEDTSTEIISLKSRAASMAAEIAQMTSEVRFWTEFSIYLSFNCPHSSNRFYSDDCDEWNGGGATFDGQARDARNGPRQQTRNTPHLGEDCRNKRDTLE